MALLLSLILFRLYLVLDLRLWILILHKASIFCNHNWFSYIEIVLILQEQVQVHEIFDNGSDFVGLMNLFIGKFIRNEEFPLFLQIQGLILGPFLVRHQSHKGIESQMQNCLQVRNIRQQACIPCRKPRAMLSDTVRDQ